MKDKIRHVLTTAVVIVVTLVMITMSMVVLTERAQGTTQQSAVTAASTNSTSNQTSKSTLYIGEDTSYIMSSLNYYGSVANYYFSSMLYVPFAAYEFPPHPYLEMMLGEGYTHNANYTQYNLTLKSNLKWDNGQPITSKDLWMTLMLNWQDGQLLNYNVTSVSILNSTTVHVSMNAPEPNFVQNWVTDTNSYVIPYSVYVQHDKNLNVTSKMYVNGSVHSAFYNISDELAFKNFKDIVADGPFVITNYTSTGENPLIFNANQYYYTGVPKMDKVVVRIFSSISSESAAMRSGQISGFWDMGSYSAIVKPNMENIPNANLSKLEPGPYMQAQFDMFKYPFNTTQMRMALAYLTNRSQINNIVNTANGTLVGYNYLTAGLDQSIGINPANVQNYNPNVAKANALLKQIGIVYNSSKSEYLYASNNTQVSFNIMTTELSFGDFDTSVQLKNQWDAAGFNVAVTIQPVTTFYDKVDHLTSHNTWDVAVVIDPLGYYPSAIANLAGVTGYSNATDYNHPASYGMSNFNYTYLSMLSKKAYEYPIDSSQANSWAQKIAAYIPTVVPSIPLWVNNNWELTSNNYFWGNSTNSTGIYNGQALVQEQFWYGTLADVHYIGSTNSGSGISFMDTIIIGVVIAAVVIGGVSAGVYSRRNKRRRQEE